MTGINTMSRMKAKIRCIGDECISKNNNLSIKFEVLYDFLELILGVIKVWIEKNKRKLNPTYKHLQLNSNGNMVLRDSVYGRKLVILYDISNKFIDRKYM